MHNAVIPQLLYFNRFTFSYWLNYDLEKYYDFNIKTKQKSYERYYTRIRRVTGNNESIDIHNK